MTKKLVPIFLIKVRNDETISHYFKENGTETLT